MVSRPLAGKRVVVTRSPEQAGVMADKLAELGAEPILLPAITFMPLPTERLAETLARIEAYDWLLFTSGNGVAFFWAYVDEAGLNLTWPKIAASGSATGRLLAERGLTPTFVPDEFVGEALVAGLGDLRGKRVLLPRAKIGRPKIVELLVEQGALVDDIPLYDTVRATPTAAMVAEIQRGFEVITFTSPSSVRNTVQIFAEHGLDWQLMAQAEVAVIGPITAAQAMACGLEVAMMPTEYTIDGLVGAVADFYMERVR